MGEVHYMISETAKRVGVESHVLRYWEEELTLPIGRTEMGHRHYTEENIQLFCCIKELKDQGMQLKEIKEILPDILRTKEILKSKKTLSEIPSETTVPDFSAIGEDRTLKPADIELLNKMFLLLMKNSLQDNNETLENNICTQVTDKISKDMTFLMDARERQEENRYRKLDHLIRQQQMSRKESSRPVPVQYLHRIFGEA